MLTTIRRCPTSSEPELNLTSVDEAPQTSSAINHWQSGDHLFHHGQLRVPEAAHLFYMERTQSETLCPLFARGTEETWNAYTTGNSSSTTRDSPRQRHKGIGNDLSESGFCSAEDPSRATQPRDRKDDPSDPFLDFAMSRLCSRFPR